MLSCLPVTAKLSVADELPDEFYEFTKEDYFRMKGNRPGKTMISTYNAHYPEIVHQQMYHFVRSEVTVECKPETS